MNKDRIAIVRILLFIFVLLCGCLIGYHLIFDYSEDTCNYGSSDILKVKGYEILDEQQYRVASDDPQLIFDTPHMKLDTVRLSVLTPVNHDIPVRIYYRKMACQYSEQYAVNGVMKAGESELFLDLSDIECDEIRFDVDGDFQYGQLSLTGSVANINIFKTVFFCIVWLILLILFWFFVSLPFGRCIFRFIGWLGKKYDKVYNVIVEWAARKKIHIGHVFCVLALFYGIAMACVVPPDQVPDELTHYYQMVESAGFPVIEKQIEDFFYKTGVGDMQGNPLVKVDKARLSEHLSDHFDKTVVNFKGLHLSIVKHLPSAVLFFIAYFLDLPVWVCLLMAELGSLIFYIVMGYLTLKYMPFKKELMCGILLLPMTVQQCASINYDSVLIPLCLFLTAYVFHCKYEKEKVGWGTFFLVLLIAGVVLPVKPTYVSFFLLVFLIPFEKWSLKIAHKWELMDFIKKYKWLVCVLGVMMIAAFLYIGRNNMFIQLLEASILRPDLTFERLYNTVKEMYSFYFMSTIAHLGWLDTLMPKMFYYFVFVCLFLYGLQDQKKVTGKSYILTWKERLFLIFIILTTVYLIIVAMFSWTMFLYDIDTGGTLEGMIAGLKKITISLGVQGRYFLPILLLCFLPFDGLLKIDKKKLFPIQCLYYPIVIFLSLWVVLQRYWI